MKGVDRENSTIKGQVFEGFKIDYITAMEICCKNKAIIENKLLLEFEYNIIAIEDGLLLSGLSLYLKEYSYLCYLK